jgi:hypothetical protein
MASPTPTSRQTPARARPSSRARAASAKKASGGAAGSYTAQIAASCPAASQATPFASMTSPASVRTPPAPRARVRGRIADDGGDLVTPFPRLRDGRPAHPSAGTEDNDPAHGSPRPHGPLRDRRVLPETAVRLDRGLRALGAQVGPRARRPRRRTAPQHRPERQDQRTPAQAFPAAHGRRGLPVPRRGRADWLHALYELALRTVRKGGLLGLH